MKWSNQAIVANAEIDRMVHMSCESAFRAWMCMYAADAEYIILPQIKATAYGCPSIDNKLVWHIWLEHYV